VIFARDQIHFAAAADRWEQAGIKAIHCMQSA
jgi:hypothetical protein